MSQTHNITFSSGVHISVVSGSVWTIQTDFHLEFEKKPLLMVAGVKIPGGRFKILRGFRELSFCV